MQQDGLYEADNYREEVKLVQVSDYKAERIIFEFST
ncbi:hypothetical protein A1E_02550 [Rickettsia canadensis str. McKiel]|uniref:Uncharacterized protein n=1 Tax=Rickettsia canadensis (strain McKiel) TaxID=293613 RepID=A8EYM1_RICCK|nr:hypothetical protein A1E_02550 [Rickettsia canadensis str. McKiel]